MQVTSQRSEADAQASYKSLQTQFPSVLGSRQPVIRKADLGDKGTYYRAQDSVLEPDRSRGVLHQPEVGWRPMRRPEELNGPGLTPTPLAVKPRRWRCAHSSAEFRGPVSTRRRRPSSVRPIRSDLSCSGAMSTTPPRSRRLTAKFRELVGRDAPVLVDQEGGRVQRLGPPHWPSYPPGSAYAALYESRPDTGLEATHLGGRLIAADLRTSASTSIAFRWLTCRSQAPML